MLLSDGNSKLGRRIWSFSIPAVETCPGATAACQRACYAKKGFMAFNDVVAKYERNYEAAQREDFVDTVVAEIRTVNAEVVRVHAAGDFYSEAYIQKWQRIARKTSARFYAYTRSWRVPELLGSLSAMAAIPNWELWFSVDKDCERVPDVPGVRVAYMAAEPGDFRRVRPTADLVFIDRSQRTAVRKAVKGVRVCPVENGVKYRYGMDCFRCGICWKPARKPKVSGGILPIIA